VVSAFTGGSEQVGQLRPRDETGVGYLGQGCRSTAAGRVQLRKLAAYRINSSPPILLMPLCLSLSLSCIIQLQLRRWALNLRQTPQRL
jgi:hypothetical protein